MRKSAQALRALWVLGNEYLRGRALDGDHRSGAGGGEWYTGLNLVALFARSSAVHPVRIRP